jgi:hypothetical protein
VGRWWLASSKIIGGKFVVAHLYFGVPLLTIFFHQNLKAEKTPISFSILRNVKNR